MSMWLQITIGIIVIGGAASLALIGMMFRDYRRTRRAGEAPTDEQLPQ